ncbi:MAG: hypothetical protein R3B67_00445 [Phycisphaerales bacterium]
MGDLSVAGMHHGSCVRLDQPHNHPLAPGGFAQAGVSPIGQGFFLIAFQ